MKHYAPLLAAAAGAALLAACSVHGIGTLPQSSPAQIVPPTTRHASALSASGRPLPSTSGPAPLLQVSANRRYLVDPQHRPFYLIGDSAWCLVARLSASQAARYFKTRATEGFNAVLLDADVQLDASPVGAPGCGPADANGNQPFDGKLPGGTYDVGTVPKPGDTTSTAAKYWRNVDAIIGAASQSGIEVIFDAYDNYNPWFGPGESPNSKAALAKYGRFLGRRYANVANIIWMIGNDYEDRNNRDGDANLLAVMRGIRRYDKRHIGWAFDTYGAGLDDATLRPMMRINTIYEYRATEWRSEYLQQYARADFAPIMNIESGYENNSSLGVTEADLREEHYSFLLSGATGDTYGNEWVWPFASTWRNWQRALVSPGARQVTHLAQFVNSIAWYELIPDRNGTVFRNVGSPEDYCGAYTADGRLAIAYRPATGHTRQRFAVNMSRFAGRVKARWYDPTSGRYASIGTFANAGVRHFSSPSKNAAGKNDFVLVLQVQ